MLYRDIQNLSFYKYGNNEENIICDANSSAFPQSVEEYQIRFFDIFAYIHGKKDSFLVKKKANF